MKPGELRDLSDAELRDHIRDRRRELFGLRFQHATGELDNTASLRRAKREVARALTVAREREIERSLTPRQRQVLLALAVNGVPIDVLAERLGSTRGALYKTLHDARQKLRAALIARGLIDDDRREEDR